MWNATLAGVFLVLSAAVDGAQAPSAPSVRTGPADAPVQVVAFCDIEQEACERLMVLLRRLSDTYPEKVGITFRHLAPDAHKQSPLAYRAALAAAKQGKAWDFLDMACANRDRLNDAGLLSMAAQLQLDVARFTADSAAGDVTLVLEDDAAEARRFKVDHVPAVFLNGIRVADASTFDALDAAVRVALK